MDLFENILTYSYLKSASLSLMLDTLPQSTPTTYTSGKTMMAEALTGRIRTNAAMLNQGAKNATEAANIASMIASTASSVVDNLNQMVTLAQEVRADSSKGSVNGAAFTTLAKEITTMVKGTVYNDISLLNKSGWTGDNRLAVSSDGKSATMGIQLGYESSKFILRDLSYLSYLENVDLSSSSLNLTDLISDITTQAATTNIVYSSNDSLSTSYANEAAFMVEQADILTKAAEDALPSEEDPLQRDIGSIISLSS